MKVGMAVQRVLSPTFAIGAIRIGQIEGASCLNMGNNWPTNFRSHKKHTQGFGSVSGNSNSVQGARTLLNDPDVIDMLALNDSETPEWFMEFVQGLNGKQEASASQSPQNSAPEGGET